MKKTQLISHKGLQIYYSDFSNLKELADFDDAINEVNSYIRSQPQNSIYTLTNFSKTFFNSTITKKISDMAAGNKPFVKTNAVIGLGGLTKIVFDGIIRVTGRDSKSFNTIEEAKEYLYERSIKG